MIRRTVIARVLGFLACGAAVGVAAGPANAAGKGRGPAAVCAAAYKSAQDSEAAGHLREARESFMDCAKPMCGGFLLQQCTNKYAQLETDIPSVVPVVNDESGAPQVDVQVMVDGEVIATRLTGQALPVDPGLHEFTFSSGGIVISTQKILVMEGQRNRPVVVSLRPSEAPPHKADGDGQKAAPGVAAEQPASEPAAEPSTSPAVHDGEPPEDAAPEPPKSGRSAVPYVLGAAGLAGMGVGAMLIYWGRTDNDSLGQCSPNCPQSSVDHIRSLYLAGDIAAGAGVVAFGVAGIWLLARSGAPAQTGVRVDVRPSQSGAMASVSGAF